MDEDDDDDYEIVSLGNSSPSVTVVDDVDPRGRKSKLSQKIPADAVDVLSQLFESNAYPTRDEMMVVCHEFGLSHARVSNWFKNKRRQQRRAVRGRAGDDDSIVEVDSGVDFLDDGSVEVQMLAQPVVTSMQPDAVVVPIQPDAGGRRSRHSRKGTVNIILNGTSIVRSNYRKRRSRHSRKGTVNIILNGTSIVRSNYRKRRHRHRSHTSEHRYPAAVPSGLPQFIGRTHDPSADYSSTMPQPLPLSSPGLSSSPLPGVDGFLPVPLPFDVTSQDHLPFMPSPSEDDFIAHSPPFASSPIDGAQPVEGGRQRRSQRRARRRVIQTHDNDDFFDDSDVEMEGVDAGEAGSSLRPTTRRMTARQRSMYEEPSGSDWMYMSLPMGGDRSEKPVQITEEMQLEREERALRRKLSHKRKMEKLKNETIARLLENTELRERRAQRDRKIRENRSQKHKERKQDLSRDCSRYLRTALPPNSDGFSKIRCSLSFPAHMQLEALLESGGQKFSGYPPKRPRCEAPGCPNPKSFRCAVSKKL
eukprot:423289_1